MANRIVTARIRVSTFRVGQRSAVGSNARKRLEGRLRLGLAGLSKRGRLSPHQSLLLLEPGVPVAVESRGVAATTATTAIATTPAAATALRAGRRRCQIYGLAAHGEDVLQNLRIQLQLHAAA